METITELTKQWQPEEKNLIAQSCGIVNTYMNQRHVTGECDYIRYLKHTGLFFRVLKHLNRKKTRDTFLDLDVEIEKVDLELDKKRLALYKSWKNNEFSDKVIKIQDKLIEMRFRNMEIMRIAFETGELDKIKKEKPSNITKYFLRFLLDYIPYDFADRDDMRISLGIKRRY